MLDPSDESTLIDTGGYIPNGFADFLISGMTEYDNRHDLFYFDHNVNN